MFCESVVDDMERRVDAMERSISELMSSSSGSSSSTDTNTNNK